MTNSMVASSGTRRSNPPYWQLGIAIALVAITLARIVYVSLYAVSLPFWDQWDELNTQFRPWLDGTWHFSLLFAPHMEHRVLFTRVVGMLLIGLNGNVFDNLVVTYANALIYAAVWAVAFALLTRNASRNARFAVLAFVIVLGVLPFDWENVVVGFQNQFYFLELAAVLLLGLTASRDPSGQLLVLLVLLAVASLFTMASGLLAAPAVCAVLVLRAWRDRTPRTGWLPVILAMLAITALGLVLLAHTHKNAAYNATGAAEFLRGWLTALMWPLQPYGPSRVLFAALAWSPLVAWLWRFGRTRTSDNTAIFAAGLAIWVLLQCLAIGWSRGHDLTALASRYTEIPALGLAANLTLALKLADRLAAFRRTIAIAAIVLATAATGWIFYKKTPLDYAQMQQRYRYSQSETANVARYLAGHPLPKLPPMDLDLPYPTAAQLERFLDMPDMRALLPPSLFPPPKSRKHVPLSTLASGIRQFVQGLFPAAARGAGMTARAPVEFRRYTGILSNTTINRQCALDGIDGHPSASAGPIGQHNIVTFDGWAGNGHGRLPSQALLVLQNGRAAYAASIVPGIDRPDVARVWKKRGLTESGFHLVASMANLTPGTYALYITDVHAGDATCDLHRTVTVR